MAGQEDSNGCINYEGGLGTSGSLGAYREEADALGRPVLMSQPLLFFTAFVKHIMAS